MDLTLKQKQIDRICFGDHPDPFSFLGVHRSHSPVKTLEEYFIRVFLPKAASVSITGIPDSGPIKMKKLDTRGFFESRLRFKPKNQMYMLKVTNINGSVYETYDPYSFDTVISDYDIYLFNEGTHSTAYNCLGAHKKHIGDIQGIYFALWAPNAKRASVIGQFNEWDGRRHPMRKLGMSGIFEIFIPGLSEYDLYKYEILTQPEEILVKSDPFSFYNEVRPKTASVIYDIDKYEWKDKNWLDKRKLEPNFDKPVSIYECHLQSWLRDTQTNDHLTYEQLAPKLTEYTKRMGYTHVELMPVMEHPFDGSWGYQVSGYYAATSRLGEPAGLMALIDMLHENDIGVILDWVPGHFPKDSFALEKFDGTCLYEYEDPLKAEHKDWGTLAFNYARNEVRSFLVSNAVFWFEKYHVDGLRVDAVASMLYLDYSRKDGEWAPNEYGGKENLEAIEFLKHLNSVVHSYFPNAMMIAEESTSYPLVTRPVHSGGLGFSYKWNMGWMNDFIRYIHLDPYYRKYNHNLVTFSIMYNYSENFILPLSHDEVVHGKGSMMNKIPGDSWQKFATLRTALSFMFSHPGKKMLFMGIDIAQFGEWDHDSQPDWSLLDDEKHNGFNLFVQDLIQTYKENKEFFELDYSPEGFEWINVADSDRSIFSFIRYSKDRSVYALCVFNFTPVVYSNYLIGVPTRGDFREILNSDSFIYGGSNVGNLGSVSSQNTHCNGRPYSISITVPPLGSLVFLPDKDKRKA